MVMKFSMSVYCKLFTHFLCVISGGGHITVGYKWTAKVEVPTLFIQ